MRFTWHGMCIYMTRDLAEKDSIQFIRMTYTSCRTCVTNHMKSMSHYYLFIALGVHTDTDINIHTDDPHQIKYKKPGARQPQRAWFKIFRWISQETKMLPWTIFTQKYPTVIFFKLRYGFTQSWLYTVVQAKKQKC